MTALAEISVEAQRSHAALFLKALFDDKPVEAMIMIVEEGKWSTPRAFRAWHPAVESVWRKPDVYVGACALRRKPGKGSRGKKEEARFMPAAWMDVDVNGSPQRDGGVVKDHAPSRVAAVEAIHALAEPTMTIDSGYGFQPWWVLERGVVFSDAAQQRKAERIVQGMQRRLAHDAGWEVDSVGDLARVMRCPGTTNTKGPVPAPVMICQSGGPRYTIEQLEELAGVWMDEPGDAVRGATPASDWVDLVQTGGGGTRHERIWSLSGYLLRRGLDPAVAYELVSCFNDARIDQPYDERTLRKHFDGILREEIKRRKNQPFAERFRAAS